MSEAEASATTTTEPTTLSLETCTPTTDCAKELAVEEPVCCYVQMAAGITTSACKTMKYVEEFEKSLNGVTESEVLGIKFHVYCTGALKLAGVTIASLSMLAAY